MSDNKYLIHFNGSRPFMVEITQKVIYIYRKQPINEPTNEPTHEPIHAPTNDNTNTPIKVKVDETQYWDTFLEQEISKNNYNYTDCVMRIDDYNCVSIGEDKYHPEFKGNTILVECLNDGVLSYIYIADVIYKFYVPNNDPIIVYYSPIGNSDVPYPVAISENYIYLMRDKVMIPGKDYSPRDLLHPYHFYYKNKSLGIPLQQFESIYDPNI